MLAILGFAVGYVLGAKAGPEGLSQLTRAWQTIQSSEEFAAMLETGRALAVSVAKQAVEKGTGVVGSEVRGAVGRRLRAA